MGINIFKCIMLNGLFTELWEVPCNYHVMLTLFREYAIYLFWKNSSNYLFIMQKYILLNEILFKGRTEITPFEILANYF